MTPSASSLWLLSHCAWWARPEVPTPVRTSSEYQALGSAAHEAVDLAIAGIAIDLQAIATKHDADAADLATAYETWRAWRSQQPADEAWSSEVAVAWNPATDTARALAVGGHRAYDVAAGEIPGTMDALRVAADGTVEVVDWKVGEDWQGYTADAAENRQLAFYALAVARLRGVESVRVTVARITEAGVVTDSHDLDALALDALAGELRAQLATIPASRPQPGAHCGRCKAAAVCPASSAAAQSLALSTAPNALVLDTPEAAGKLHARIALVDAALKQARAALDAWGEAGGEIVMPDGKRLALRQQTRTEYVVNEDAVAALVAHGLDGAIERPAPKLTKAALERAIKARGEAVAPTLRAVEESLFKAQAIRTVPHGARWMPAKK